MGILDKAIDGINRVARPFQNLATPVDPRIAKGYKVGAQGDTAFGTIVGIQRIYKHDATHTTYGIEVAGSPATGPLRFGTEVTTSAHHHWLRLGLTLPIRLDGDRGVIDWSALSGALGLGDDDIPGQRPKREAPEPGIDERSLTSREKKLLRDGRRTSATLEGTKRCTVLGLPTLNWDMHLRLADGSTATIETDEVPPYAWWLAVPGATLPLAVDTGNPEKTKIDWAEATLKAAGAAPISLDQRPPAGSIAAEVIAGRVEPTTVALAAPTDPATIISANRDVAMANNTLRDWASEVQAGRMKPKAFLKNVAEWESAGMCTPEEAAAARAAAGLR